MAADDPIRRVPSADSEDQPTLRGLAAGRRVFNRYVLETPVGRGGMGVVWRAQDEELDRKVALKFLPEVVAGDAEAVRDLKRETKRCLELTHSNIVRVYDFVQETPMAAIAMELIDGQSLAKRKVEAPGGCLSVAEVAPLAAQLCAALDYAHRTAKVVHRDLKPANLLLTRDGHLKVTDFGIARSLTDTHTRLTGRAGDTSGTLVYMSPQQLMGKTPTVADDIYTLGATLYDLLTGKPPFYSGDIVTQVRELVPPSLMQRRNELEMAGHLAAGSEPIPQEWEDTIRACLAKEPEDRPPSVAEVARRMGLAGLEPGLGKAETGPATAGAARPGRSGAEFPNTGGRSGSTKQGPVTRPPPVAARNFPVIWVAAIAATAVLLSAITGYYFGIYLPGRRARLAAGTGEGAMQPAAEKAQPSPTVPVEDSHPVQPEKHLPTAPDNAQTAKEQSDYTIIMTLVGATRDGSSRDQVNAAERAVQAYLDAAPEQYRTAVTAAWFKRKGEWERAGAASAKENLPPPRQVPPPGVRAVEPSRAMPVNARHGGPVAAQPWTIPESALEMVWIPQGTFEMGSPSAESGRSGEESPQTKVTLTMPFWLGKTEVTQAQWKAVMGTNPSSFKGDDLPVDEVSWADAMEYCRKLSQRERAAGRLPDGYEYTLPTEAQWEYACRAGTTDPVYGKLNEFGWYADNSGNTTHAVAKKRPNIWGLFDMHGNVGEWCRDWYGKYPGESVTDYTGPASGTLRVARGGAWPFLARNCRSASRSHELPGAHMTFIGFRVALCPAAQGSAN